MRGLMMADQMETVVVTVRGRVLDSASFRVKAEAEAYKRNVRRWAFEKGIVVTLWSGRQAAPVAEGWDVPAASLAAC